MSLNRRKPAAEPLPGQTEAFGRDAVDGVTETPATPMGAEVFTETTYARVRVMHEVMYPTLRQQQESLRHEVEHLRDSARHVEAFRARLKDTQHPTYAFAAMDLEAARDQITQAIGSLAVVIGRLEKVDSDPARQTGPVDGGY